MLNRIDRQLYRLAIESDGVANGRVRMAAAVIYKKNVIAFGVNQMKTHPLMCEQEGYREGQIYLHAEADAIRNSLRLIDHDQLKQCSLRVIRLKRPGIGSQHWTPGLAKPCPGCRQLIDRVGITDVSWTEDDDSVIYSHNSLVLTQ